MSINKGEATTQNTTATVTHLPTDQLQPNDYNPNRMTDEEFAELVEEVRHLGRLPKPVVVREVEDGYLIVDGEHGWRAACEVGLSEIPCEVIEADDFEAMRQTYKRNQHGTHDLAALGRMFYRMRQSRAISNRQLAEEINVSEGTVRNALIYAEATKVRNGYAFDRLPIRAVRTYLRLPEIVRDAWLDSGADTRALWEAGSVQLPMEDMNGNEKMHHVVVESPEDWQILVDAGLAEYLDGTNKRTFVRSGRLLWRLEHWLSQHRRYIPGVEEYVKVAAELGLDTKFLDDDMPVEQVSSEEWRPILPADEWRQVFLKALEYAGDDDTRFRTMAKSALRVALAEFGYAGGPDPHNPVVAEALMRLNAEPEFIREADIPLAEKLAVAWATGAPHVPDEVLLEAKRSTCAFLERKKRAFEGDDKLLGKLNPEQRSCYLIQHSKEPLEVLEEEIDRQLREREHEAMLARREELFADRDKLTDATIEALRKLYLLREGTVGGRPALEVLRDRLGTLPEPEFRLLASLVVDEKIGPAEWLRAVGGKQPGGSS